MLIELQTQQLSDNIRTDMDLLEDNDNELRYESDPLPSHKYRREIERQRESLSRYQQEYYELALEIYRKFPGKEHPSTFNGAR